LRTPLLAFGLLLICCGEILSSQTAKPAPSLNQAAPQLLTTVAQVRALSDREAAKGLAVELHATLTYYEPAEGQTFVQDATGGIYVFPPPRRPKLASGGAVVVRGTTAPSYETNIRASEMLSEGESRFPKPVPVNWRKILEKVNDCRYVSMTGTVRSATLQLPNAENALDSARRREGMATAGSPPSSSAADESQPYILMDLQTDGGAVRVHMEDVQGIDPLKLLDSQVLIDGVAGGIFDGKYQQTGSELWVSSAKHMKVLKPASGDPGKLPLTEISRIMSGYFVKDQSQRVHVRGSVTLYEPGLQVVLETPDQKAVLVNTYEQAPLQIGQVVDAVGFPDSHQYSEVLTQANILSTPGTSVIQPIPIRWDDALAGRAPYDLVSMEGELAAEVHERHEDLLVIQTDSHVFSAILSRTVWNQNLDQPSLPEYRVGSRVRITGICFVHAGGPWGTERWFELQMRTPQDISVLVAPPWWTVRRLLYLSAGLLLLMMTAFFWAFGLQRKVRRQTEQIRLTMESEAARERRVGFLEKERGRVLEAINSMQNLDEVLLMILRLISTQLEDRLCWCELTNGAIIGDAGQAEDAVRRGIYSGAGERLGSLVVSGAEVYQEPTGEVLEMGASLAALAIDNRRLYETLIHRSQFDQLTNAANRFLLESRLDEALAHAERSQTRFALIYIDLDLFKQVNDLYGHRIGDAYLQQVAERFSEKLRGMDTLARVGGDEFIALIPVVRNRPEVQEITHRLTHCFDAPFRIDGYSISGTASIGIAVYPEDGLTKDELKRVADSAMYSHKPSVAVL
jgi:diguanylate cyclase (GGDEF)-like protein